MNIRFIKTPEKNGILAELEKIYGIKKLSYLLLETGKTKLRAFSGHLSKVEIMRLGMLTNVELIGMYLINKKDEDPRINFDAVSLLREQITKSVVKIDEQQFQQWIRGHDLQIKVASGIVVVKHDEDLVGIGKSNGEKIFNYVPKERKIKSKLN